MRFYRLLKARGLTQVESAGVLGTTQAQVSTLMRSVGRLMAFLTTVGQDNQGPSVRRGGRM